MNPAELDMRQVVPLEEIPQPSLADVKSIPGSRTLSVATKASYAVTGQALFAGAHFLVNVLLARWLPAEEYGAFALAYACFLLFTLLYNACVYEPLIVFGSGKYASRFREYLGVLFWLNVPLLAAVTLTMLGLSVTLGHIYSPIVRHAFAVLAVAAPFVLVTWLGRGGFYSQLRPGGAAIGGVVYFFTLLAALLSLWHYGRLSAGAAFWAMGAAGLAASLWLLTRLGVRFRRFSGDIKLETVITDHWRYGRWAMASALVAWFPDNIYYAVLGRTANLEGTAALRALVNLINPMVHVQIALSAVLIPALVRRHARAGFAAMNRMMAKLLAISTPAAVVYLALLWFYRFRVFETLYRGHYETYASGPLFLVALIPLASGPIMVFGSGLRAMARPDSIFWSYVIGVATTLCLGLPFAVKWGVAGATLGLLIASCVTALSMAWLFHRHTLQSAR